MQDIILALGSGGGAALLTQIVNTIFGRRKAKAEVARVEAEAEKIDVSTLELLQRMYLDAMKEVRALGDELRTLNKKVDACDEERRELLAKVEGLERKLGIVKEAL